MRIRFYTISCFFVLCLSFLFISMAALAQYIPEEALDLKEQGDRAMTKGDIDQAIYLYEKALRVYPDFPEVVYYLGLTYELDLQDLQNAIYYYQRYLDIAPTGAQSAEVLSRLQDVKKELAAIKRESGILEKQERTISESVRRRGVKKAPLKTETPPTPATAPPPVIPEPDLVSQEAPVVVSAHKAGDIFTLQIHEKLLKYNLKLAVWEREGFIERFNELGQIMVSPLEMDIAGLREALRMERKKVTDFINYQDEAIRALMEKAILQGMTNLGIVLDHFPNGWDVGPFIHSSAINETHEDKKFVDITMEISLNITSLHQELLSNGYIFEPNRITIILQGVQGNLADILTENIIRHSNYTGPSSGGLYPIYTSLDEFEKELTELKIGKYRFYPVSVGNNSITIQVLADSG